MTTKMVSLGLLMLFFHSSSFAQTFASSPYEYCGDARGELPRVQGQASQSCQKRVQQASECCNGSSGGCLISANLTTAGGGNKAASDLTAQSSSAVAASLNQNIEFCDNAEMQAVVACNSSAQDKAYEKDYRRRVQKLTSCLGVAAAQMNTRAVAAEQSSGAASATPAQPAQDNSVCTSPGEKSAEDIISCLKQK